MWCGVDSMDQTFAYLRNKKNVIQKMLDKIELPAVHELLMKLIHCNEISEGDMIIHVFFFVVLVDFYSRCYRNSG